MDLATLGLRIESQEVDTAERRLDSLTASAARVETATQAMSRTAQQAIGGVSAASGRASSAAQEMANAIRAEEAALLSAARASGTFNSRTAQTEAALGSASAAAQRAAMSYNDFYNEAQRDFATQYVAQMNRVNAVSVRGGRGMKLAAHEVTNLGRQFADIGVMLASGQNPLMTLLQQGPQVADVFHTAGQRGIGFTGVLRGIGAMLAPLLPVLLAVGAAVGVVAGGFGILTQQINKGGESAKEIQKRLHLTDEQMKKVRNTSVTMGDTISATFSVIGDRIWDAIGPTMKDVGKVIAEVYQDVVDWTGGMVRKLVMLWGGALGAIGAAWKTLPAAVGEAVVAAVNFVLGAVEKMINFVVDKINVVIAGINFLAAPLAAVIGFEVNIPALEQVKITRIANQFEGAGETFGDAMAKGWKEGAVAGGKAFDQFFADIDAKAKANRDKRVLKEAGKGPKGSKASSAESDFDRALADAQEAVLVTNMQAAATERLNAEVAAGLITSAEAARQREIEDRLAPYRLAADKANGAQKTLLLGVVTLLEQAYRRLNAAEDDAANLRVIEDQGRAIEYLQAENRLIGEGNVVRAVQLAQLRERQAIVSAGMDPNSQSSQDRIAGAGDVARQMAANAMAQDLYNEALDRTLDRLTEIEDLVATSADGLADAFEGMSDGAAGFTRALGGILSAMNRLAVTEEKINRRRAESFRQVEDAAATGNMDSLVEAARQHQDLMTRSAEQMANAQVGAYAEMIGAAKGFFEEGSDGYRALQAAEIAFRAVQMALSIQAMAQHASETTTGIAQSMSKAVASTIAGVAKAFEQMGIWGFVGAGAILAFMGAVGVNAGGGGAPAYDLDKVQERQGTGTVLGDAGRKSESIVKSLELVAEHTNDMLEYNSEMLRALRGIEDNIQNLAAAVARSLSITGIGDVKPTSYNPITGRDASGEINKVLLGAGGAADWSQLAKAFSQPFGSGNILRDIFNPGPIDPLGLFDSKISKKLVDAGISFTADSLGKILSDGLKASYFQVLRTTREDKAFGFTYQTSVKDKTAMTAVEADLQRQFSLVIGSLRDGVLSAAKVLGVDGAAAVLEAFQVNIGRVSFKDMDSAEITATLEAIFSKLGDEMATAVLPGLTEFQKAGEGLFETLMRVAREYQVVDVTLASIGMTFGAVGLSSVAARQRLVDLFGSLDEFVEQTAFYAENFLTEAERLAPIQSAVTTELNRLGLANVRTRDQFKAVVQGLDVSTAAGAELYAALMALAPAFAAITEETEAIRAARDDLSSAYDRESSALADTIDRFTDLASSLGKYRTSLFSGPAAALSPEEQYRAARAEFDRINALAATGDQQALGDLQSVSEAYLEASRDYFASSQGYFADLARVRDAVTAAELSALDQVDVAEAQLDELKALVAGFLDINESVLSVRDAVDNLAALLAPTLPQAPLTWPGETAKSGDAANDNQAAVIEAIAALQEQMAEVGRQLAAANEQRAGVHAETIAVLQAQQAALERQLREMQAA